MSIISRAAAILTITIGSPVPYIPPYTQDRIFLDQQTSSCASHVPTIPRFRVRFGLLIVCLYICFCSLSHPVHAESQPQIFVYMRACMTNSVSVKVGRSCIGMRLAMLVRCGGKTLSSDCCLQCSSRILQHRRMVTLSCPCPSVQ